MFLPTLWPIMSEAILWELMWVKQKQRLRTWNKYDKNGIETSALKKAVIHSIGF